MLTALYAAAVAVGAALAQLGDEPIWIFAVAALAGFPFAAAAAGRRRGSSPGHLPTLLTGLTGGVLVGLSIRLAVLAPGWESLGTVDCGGPALEDQQLVLWVCTVLFVLAAVPVAAILGGVGVNLSRHGTEGFRVPLSFYPLGVAAAGLALVGASLVTSC